MYQPEKDQMEIFAENLAEIMARKRISQNQLAKKIGVSAMSVNKWARGLAMPRRDNSNGSDWRRERDLNPFYLCTPMYCGELRCTFFIVFDEVPTKRSYKKWHRNGHHLLS